MTAAVEPHPFDQWATPDVDVTLDADGRHYLIQPPARVDLEPYLRTTSFIDVISETSHLDRWRRRILLEHFAANPREVHQQIVAAVNHPTLSKSKALDELARQLHTAAGGDEKRDYGTEIHEALRCWLLNEPFRPTEDRWLPEIGADLAAIKKLLEEHRIFIDPAYVEVPLALHDLKVAGRTDGFTLPGGHGPRRVIDLKSGSISPVSWAMQLAVYAHADHIVSDAGRTLTDMPEIDRKVGYIINAPKGKGEATLWEVDLEAGWADVQLAVEIHRVRSVKQADRITRAKPRQPVEERPVVPVDATKVSWLTDRVRNILTWDGSLEQLAQSTGYTTPGDLMAGWWPEGVPTLKQGGHTTEQLDAIAERVSMVEAELGMMFPDTDPEVEADNVRVPADDPRVTELIDRLKSLPTDLLAEVEDEAAAAGITNRISLGLPLGQLRDLDIIVDAFEATHETRREKAQALLDQHPADVRDVLEELCGDAWSMTAREVVLLDAFTEGLLGGYLELGGRAGLAATTAGPDLLKAIHSNRRNCLLHVKRQAKAHGLIPPSSFVDICDDPRLIALALCDLDAPATPATA